MESEAQNLLQSIIEGDSFNQNLPDEINEVSVDYPSQFLNGTLTFEEYQHLLEYGSNDEEDDRFSLSDEDWLPSDKKNVQETEKRERSRIKRSNLPKHLQGLMGTANLQWANGHISEAFKICMEIISSCPSAHEPYSLLSVLYKETGEPQKALQNAIIAANLDTSLDPNRWIKLAEHYMDDGQTVEALKYTRKAITSLRYKIKRDNNEQDIFLLISLCFNCALEEEKLSSRKALQAYEQLYQYMLKFRVFNHPEIKEQNVIVKIAQLLQSQKNDAQAYKSLQAIFVKYPVGDIDHTIINLYLDVAIKTGNYFEVLIILGKVCAIDFLSPALVKSNVDFIDNCFANRYINLPSNLPIDLQCKLGIALILLQKKPQYNFFDELYSFHENEGLYTKLLTEIEQTLLSLEPNMFGDLYIDLIEAYKIKPDIDIANNATLHPTKMDSSTFAYRIRDLHLKKSLTLFYKLLGITTPNLSELIQSLEKNNWAHFETQLNATNYVDVPGIWLSFSEVLEYLNYLSLALEAIEKVLAIIPNHFIAKFKYRTLNKKLGIELPINTVEKTSFDAVNQTSNLNESKDLGNELNMFPYPAPYYTLQYFSNLNDLDLLEECLKECQNLELQMHIHQHNNTSALMLPSNHTTENIYLERFINYSIISYVGMGLSIIYSLALDNTDERCLIPKSFIQRHLHATKMRLQHDTHHGDMLSGLNHTPLTNEKYSMASKRGYYIMNLAKKLFERMIDTLTKLVLQQESYMRDNENIENQDRAKFIHDTLNTLLFFLLCGAGYRNLFCNKDIRKQLKYNVTFLAIKLNNWPLTMEFLRMFIRETDTGMNNIQINDSTLSTDQMISLTESNHKYRAVYVLNTSLLNTLIYVFNKTLYPSGDMEDACFKTPFAEMNLTESRSSHEPINPSVVKLKTNLYNFNGIYRLLRSRLNQCVNSARVVGPTYEPLNQLMVLTHELLHSFALASINMSIGYHGSALSECRNLLVLAHKIRSFLTLNPECLNIYFGPDEMDHIEAQTYFMLGVCLLNHSCKPYTLHRQAPIFLGFPSLDAQKSYEDCAKILAPYIPITYAFICFSMYRSLRVGEYIWKNVGKDQTSSIDEKNNSCLQQEVLYNIGRAFHQVNMIPQALHYYEEALSVPPARLQSPSTDANIKEKSNNVITYDLTKHIAFNLRAIYMNSESYDMASYITQKYLQE